MVSGMRWASYLQQFGLSHHILLAPILPFSDWVGLLGY
jgi:hypothetical protein